MSIERILQAAAKAGSQEVCLIPGRRIVFVTPAGDREVQGVEQTSATIDQLLAPIITPEARLQTGKRYGMCLMNESFLDLVKRKIVDPQEAYAKAADKTNLLSMYRKNNIDTSWAPQDPSAPATPTVAPGA